MSIGKGIDAGVAAAGQGRLAQVIATRGGLAAPEAPFVIEHREALIYMLCEAAELEHTIMCQYLFAAFSLKQSADEGLTGQELAAVTRWRRQVSHVAAQEMLHLALVQNMLSAIGAAPHLARPNLPAPASHYPAGVQLALSGASLAGAADSRAAPGGASADEAARRPATLEATGERGAAARADSAGAAAQPAPGTVPGRVWELARAATRLRVRLGRAGRCPAELAEATAALQDLAWRLAVPAEAETHRDDLWELQAGLPASIQAMRNGPYLVTNVPRVIDHLGAGERPAPQLALCRCGKSAIRPFCDGSHASSGFGDAKDPRRIPDRRDAYPGLELTVFDNHGICQHSGLCTGRLATVFRTGAEPFVAPSGGRMDEIIRAVRDCPSGALSFAIDGMEAREQADWGGVRPPAIEVTKDGPYRITGGIQILGADGAPEPRADGASLEHCALCRCGHSQNKPFCSGMHWYVGFTDPAPTPGPTLFEWAGGLPALTRLSRLLYEKYVPADPLLAPAFADMPPGQPRRLADWLAGALGGPAAPGPDGDLRRVAGFTSAEFGEEQRARWAALASTAADEAGLAADPGFRSALSSCVDWVSRAGLAPAEAAAQPLPEPGQPVGFAAHIKKLFRQHDRQSMSFAFDLWSYDDVRAHAADILARLQDGSMPCDGAWPTDKIKTFQRWIDTGMQP